MREERRTKAKQNSTKKSHVIRMAIEFPGINIVVQYLRKLGINERTNGGMASNRSTNPIYFKLPTCIVKYFAKSNGGAVNSASSLALIVGEFTASSLSMSTMAFERGKLLLFLFLLRLLLTISSKDSWSVATSENRDVDIAFTSPNAPLRCLSLVWNIGEPQ